MIIGRFKATFTIKRPTRLDRLWFAFDHLRCCGMRVAWHVVFGRTTAVRHFGRDEFMSYPTFFLNHGYATHRNTPSPFKRVS